VRRPFFPEPRKSEKLPQEGAVTPRDNRDEDRKLTFEQIQAKYQSRIYSVIYRMVGDRDDAEDLTVETFVNAWRHWDRFRGDAQVSTWLHQIAINNCKNRFKQRDRQRGREVMSLDDSIETDSGELTREVADWTTAPEKLLLEGEFQQKIQEAIEALAPEYREVLLLAQYEDLPYEEIASITGLTVPTVKTRLHRARLKVRQRLEPYYQGWMARQK
jgi:RNA polymerase sigma-70 factor, ECF subfamily